MNLKEYIDYIKDNPQGYWFKARLYGWGWVPAKKEGWLLLFIYILIILIPGILMGNRIETGEQFLTLFLPLVAISTAVLIGICYKKGEKPSWNWGNTKEKDK